MINWFQIEGSPFPLGVNYIENEKAYNFALFSKYASKIQLLLYTEEDTDTPELIVTFNPEINKTHDIWHYRISEEEVNGCVYYAYRIWGPNSDRNSHFHRFDPHKILLDPYAKIVHFPEKHNRQKAIEIGANDGCAPLGVIHPLHTPFDWGKTEQIGLHHTNDLIIYEMHVGQFTENPNSNIPENHRGTFQGIIDKIDHLKELGVTCVELMPVHQWDPQEGSSWGYMTLNFFAPHDDYSSDKTLHGPTEEFKKMVKALHEAKILVIMDVVYNHTTEEGDTGPNYSFKGIDCDTYYMSEKDHKNDLIFSNYSGCGNTMNCSKNAVRSLILDSLRYWVTEMHIDGFRFDLASVFARNADGSINLESPPIFHEINSDPVLSNIIILAEPWDLGSSLLGKSFPGLKWSQWNGNYRDEMKKFLKGDEGMVTKAMNRIYGSRDDLFPDDIIHSYRPFQTLNYLASHDGFTLYDCVAYSDDNTDEDHKWSNQSWNSGWEGEKDVPKDVMRLRKRQVKNMISLLMFSNGIPMFRAGDEFMHTQTKPDGVSAQFNPYNIYDETVWVNWERKEKRKDVFRFFKKIIAFRKEHSSIFRSRFWKSDVRWYGAEGDVNFNAETRQLAYYLKGQNETLKIDDNDLYIMINTHWEPQQFTIMEKGEWYRIIDTSKDSPNDFLEIGKEKVKDKHYTLDARTFVVLCKK